MAVLKDETPGDPRLRPTSSWSARRCASLVDRAGLQPGRSDQDGHGRQRAGTQHAGLRRRRDGATGSCSRRAPPKGLRLTFEDQGPGIPDLDAGPDRRLHDRQGAGPGPERLEAAGQRVRDRVAGRRGDPRHDHEMEVTAARGATRRPADRPRPARSARPGGRRRPLAGRLGFDETGRGQGRPGRHRGGDQPRQARPGRRARLILRASSAGAVGGPGDPGAGPGPGMADVGRCLADGYSTAGSPGTGLGADRPALPTTFDIYSPPGVGHGPGRPALGRRRRPPRTAPVGLEFGAVSLPDAGRGGLRRRLGGRASSTGRTLLLVADGLGHGPQAAEAAAGRRPRLPGTRRPAARPRSSRPPTRPCGAPAAPPSRSPRSTPTAARSASPASATSPAPSSLPARAEREPGLAQRDRRATSCARSRSSPTPGRPGSLLVMHSDGLATHWQLDRYPGLAARHPALIAGVLYRDFTPGPRRRRRSWSLRERGREPPDEPPLLTLEVRLEQDVVLARQRARQVAGAAGLRRPGPDPDRHGRLGDRPQRLPVRRRRPGRVPRRGRGAARAS